MCLAYKIVFKIFFEYFSINILEFTKAQFIKIKTASFQIAAATFFHQKALKDISKITAQRPNGLSLFPKH